MKTKISPPSPWVIAVLVAIAGVLTAAVMADVKAGTIVVLVFAGLIYALIWEGGTRISGAIQRRMRKSKREMQE
jgi:hypothetical protein